MDQTKKTPIYSNSDLFNVLKSVDSVAILEYIKKKQPVSIWQISKEMKVGRNSLYYLLRNLEFAGVIRSKISTNESNRVVRLIYYNKKKEKGECDDVRKD